MPGTRQLASGQAAAARPGRLAADRAWVRWGMAAAVTGMLAWVARFALIPLDAKLDKGEQHLAQVLRAHTGQLYAAALLAILGAVLLAAFFAVLTRRRACTHTGTPRGVAGPDNGGGILGPWSILLPSWPRSPGSWR